MRMRDELVEIQDWIARPEGLRPWVVSAAAGIAAFAVVYRFDFDVARKLSAGRGPYHDPDNRPYSVVWGHCITGIAGHRPARHPFRREHFREGLRIAIDACGIHSHPARLASALLGELLYERDEAALYLDSPSAGQQAGHLAVGQQERRAEVFHIDDKRRRQGGRGTTHRCPPSRSS
jgi:hypothetical protein